MTLTFTGDDGDPIDESEYPSVMFLMHKWFMTSEELGEAFVDLYPFHSVERETSFHHAGCFIFGIHSFLYSFLNYININNMTS